MKDCCKIKEVPGLGELSNFKRPVQAPQKAKSWRDYLPLIVLISLSLLAALSKQSHYGAWSFKLGMHDFMGFFLLVFAMFKLFDIPGFAKSFQKYDLLAKRSKGYAMVYPFLEVALGLGYLGHFQPEAVYIATVVLMGFGAIGVLSALRQKLDINCACMGSALNVPLSVVALTEDLGMAGMAALMLVL